MGVRISELAAVGFVIFQPTGAVLHMLHVSHPPRRSLLNISLGVIPNPSSRPGPRSMSIRTSVRPGLHSEEDRTGGDYYGRIDRHDQTTFRLFDRKVVSVSYHDALLVFDQDARTDDGQRILVHYYLTLYNPSPDFRPFEMKHLRRFGFYEPTRSGVRAVGFRMP